MELSERFWAKVRKSDGCWEWTAAIRNGYGVIGAGGRSTTVLYAHRASWTLHFGDIPSGMYVLHTCDNRRCVRPDHLWLGTNRDNLADMRAKGRGYNLPSHSRTDHPRARLTEEAIREIRATIGQRDGAALARKYGVTTGHISNIRHGRAWH